jgi:hypothetical protein
MNTPYKHEPAAVAAADLPCLAQSACRGIAGSFIPAPLTALQPAIVFVSAFRNHHRGQPFALPMAATFSHDQSPIS